MSATSLSSAFVADALRGRSPQGKLRDALAWLSGPDSIKYVLAVIIVLSLFDLGFQFAAVSFWKSARPGSPLSAIEVNSAMCGLLGNSTLLAVAKLGSVAGAVAALSCGRRFAWVRLATWLLMILLIWPISRHVVFFGLAQQMLADPAVV
jgi:hypothetical protein